MTDHRTDGQRAQARVDAYLACIALVREAVAVRRAHAAALHLTPEERAARPDTWRLPELNLQAWYERADAAIRELDLPPRYERPDVPDAG